MDNINTNNYHDRQLFNERRSMIEIDNMLDTWVRNSIIRNKLRKLIIKEINKHKQNTNTIG